MFKKKLELLFYILFAQSAVKPLKAFLEVYQKKKKTFLVFQKHQKCKIDVPKQKSMPKVTHIQ